MNNEDLKRFFPTNDKEKKPNGFVRYNEDGTLDTSTVNIQTNTLFGKYSICVPKGSTSGNYDLYRHHLKFYYNVGTTEATVIVEYLSSSNLKVDSLTDLKTLLNIGDVESGEINPIGSVVYSSYTIDGSTYIAICQLYFKGQMLYALDGEGNEISIFTSGSISDTITTI